MLGLFGRAVRHGGDIAGKDAKKVYAHTTAAALRSKEDVMKTVTRCGERGGHLRRCEGH